MNRQFTFIDLFAGIGGFKMALTSQGGECLGFSEIHKDAIETYCHNYKIKPTANFGDIRQIKDLPKHDLLTAGVPCQSWSIAGKNLGFDDDRGQLWNDTIYLLNKSKPKAFIFENVKGLVDPRNKSALSYILQRIKKAGYYASYYVINSHDYGVAQNRIRIYIIGFKEEKYFKKFNKPNPVAKKTVLSDILHLDTIHEEPVNHRVNNITEQLDLFDVSEKTISTENNQKMSLSSKNGFNDYFLFNDLRNGETTIHSWDIEETTKREKEVCLLLLKNRRKKQFGLLDGNPLSLAQFQSLDSSITPIELCNLVEKNILKKVPYKFKIIEYNPVDLNDEESKILDCSNDNMLQLDEIKVQKPLRINNGNLLKILESLEKRKILQCVEKRYEFKNTKISSGINGVNRIFMPTSDVFPTLVASDTNDYIALKNITPKNHDDYKNEFLKKIYFANEYRKITKEEACLIQGFPADFKLPESRPRWMKLIGNSVSVPVIDALAKSIIETGVFRN